MNAVTRKHRFGVGLAIAAIALLAIVACALAFGPSGSGPAGAARGRISLAVPPEAKPGGVVLAHGRIAGVAGRARIQLQARRIDGWRSLGGARVRRRFRISFVMPPGQGLEMRAVLFQGRRSAAVSPTRHIAVSSEAGDASAGRVPTGTASPEPSTIVESGSAGEASPTEPSPPEPPPATNAYWGAWIGSQFTGIEGAWDMRAITDFEAVAGKAPSLIEFGSAFADCSSGPCSFYSFPTTPLEEIRNRGAIPFLSWSSQSVPSRVSEPEYRLADVVAGDYDGYIREFAEAAAAWGHPFFLRFDWEMNGDWFPWGVGVNGNTPADYVAAWRHVHQIFAQAGATNATWVWCPYVEPDSDTASFYPGDEYVDWTCLDGYNWGPSAPSPRKWRSFSSLFGPSYRLITEVIAPSKPMLVGEVASSEDGGSKEGWIADAFTALPVEFPQVQGLIWFDKYDDGMDWPLETSGGATAAFAAGIGDPRYLADSFAHLSKSPIPRP